ncbi:hypothetical protein B0H17DRAFT_1206081 [Mycena rosella]|uniref:Uncharacterized protein n=1 Tax=Mycena rosella TaxID=1033263 RepID=A0AAD7D624_MYCRO|nr:hypothetical protein B0H17DRAFT_1206081 [Mycena rosella]
MLTTLEPDEMTKDPRQTPVIRAIMHFLTTDRSEEERKALQEKLSTCRCKLRDPAVARLHLGVARPDDEVIPPDFNAALSALTSIISTGLRFHLNEKLTHKNSSALWALVRAKRKQLGELELERAASQ